MLFEGSLALMHFCSSRLVLVVRFLKSKSFLISASTSKDGSFSSRAYSKLSFPCGNDEASPIIPQSFRTYVEDQKEDQKDSKIRVGAKN